MIADLHVHTTFSDGSDTFEEVLAQAQARGIARVAFTNHDTTAGLDAAAALGPRFGVEVVGGIEVSAWDARRERKVHVLGLGVHEDAPALTALCAPLLERRRANSLGQLDRLVEAGYAIDAERALALGQASTCLYKQHLMAALTSEPYASAAYRTLYRRLFKNGGICERDIAYVDARDAVAAIVKDGGLAVLAHPGQLDSYDLVPALAACGLGGIERHHPDHASADHARCADLAERYHLACTSGSDYHGRFGSIPYVGYRIPVEALAPCLSPGSKKGEAALREYRAMPST
ncbi:MAG: phosphoribosyl 1,2-cyclic phosphate 1,2-diphosphodiesterase [Gordonibacter sp.]